MRVLHLRVFETPETVTTLIFGVFSFLIQLF